MNLQTVIANEIALDLTDIMDRLDHLSIRFLLRRKTNRELFALADKVNHVRILTDAYIETYAPAHTVPPCLT